MKTKLTLNLGPDEFITAVRTQPKPLIIPLCAELPLPDISPLDLYEGIRTECGFLLESMEGSEKLARYSFIGLDPEMIVTIGDTVEIQGNEPFVSIARDPDGNNPVDQVRSILSRFQYMNVKAPRFFGGMVGYFAYNCVYSLFEKVQKTTKQGTELPDAEPDARFMLTKDCIVIDHRDKKLYIFSSPFLTYDSDLKEAYSQSVEKIQSLAITITRLARNSRSNSPRKSAPSPVPAISPVSQERFERAVLNIKDHIVAGDIFQAVISRRLDFPVSGDPFAIYASLREINPSPYMYYLNFGEEKVIGASPEMLVRVEERKVTTVPIAGTRPRGHTKTEDEKLAKELLRDKKEQAEHTMLVDLARNDLGRVCRFGSVTVSEFMAIEKFSHVQHIVSTVSGTLRDNLDCYDAFKSCFPAGTVSGAPKIRAMQLIDEQEQKTRGLYAGAVGYIGFDRNLDFAIAIRTIQVQNDRASVQVGAGIVADSVPDNEWKETENKAAAMVRAIEHSGACS
jgi:anthranilate synthase component 1